MKNNHLLFRVRPYFLQTLLQLESLPSCPSVNWRTRISIVWLLPISAQFFCLSKGPIQSRGPIPSVAVSIEFPSCLPQSGCPYSIVSIGTCGLYLDALFVGSMTALVTPVILPRSGSSGLLLLIVFVSPLSQDCLAFILFFTPLTGYQCFCTVKFKLLRRNRHPNCIRVCL